METAETARAVEEEAGQETEGIPNGFGAGTEGGSGICGESIYRLVGSTAGVCASYHGGDTSLFSSSFGRYGKLIIKITAHSAARAQVVLNNIRKGTCQNTKIGSFGRHI